MPRAVAGALVDRLLRPVLVLLRLRRAGRGGLIAPVDQRDVVPRGDRHVDRDRLVGLVRPVRDRLIGRRATAVVRRATRLRDVLRRRVLVLLRLRRPGGGGLIVAVRNRDVVARQDRHV